MDNGTNSSSNGTFEGFQSTSPPKSFWAGLLLPIVYLTILIGSLYTFSSVYRKRQISNAAKLESWFPPHKQRDVYLSLLHLDPHEASNSGDGEKKLSKVPDSVLKAALLRRAVEDIQRIVLLRSAKPALQNLLQRGSVGDEIWQRFLRAEQEMEVEIKDVANEANAFADNWGQIIFQSANEINQNRLLKERVTELQSQVDAEKAWWDKKRAGISVNFLKELEQEESSQVPTHLQRSSDDDAVLVELPSAGKKKNKGKN